MGNPLPVNLAQECRKAQKILIEFVDPAHGGLDRVIPLSVLKKAQGFAIFTVARLGFLVSARAGSGVVIARLPDDSWSAPSALGLGGLGGGFNAGAEVTDFLIILNSKAAVRSFMATGSLQVGGNLSVAVGPLGRAAEASGAINSSGKLAAMYSYSKSKGLYGGVSVEGTVLVDRSDANSKAYHRSITAKQILSGDIEAPSFAQPLISTIEKFTISGDVAAGIEEGKRSLDTGWDNDEDDQDVDSLDRQMRSARLSPASASRRNNSNFVEDYDSHRPGEYAFGGGSGSGNHPGSYQTNSPSRIKKSFMGNTYTSNSKGTDYSDSKDDYEPSPPRSNTKGRPLFSRNRSSTASGSIFGDEAAARTPSIEQSSLYQSSNGSGIRTRNSRTASFPTRFGKGEDDTDEEEEVLPTTKDVNGFELKPRDSYEEAEDLRRKPHSALTRSGTNDLLDFELDRSAVTQRQAPQTRGERDLIDFTGDASSRKNNAPRRTGSGMDELDQELMARASIDSYTDRRNDSTWAAEPSRPKMQSRTSSTQKIFNRLRGNSQSNKNAFANIETWEQRSPSSSRRSHSPDLMGTATPPTFKSSTPTGFRGATPPTSFKSTTPTGYRGSTTPTGYKSNSSSPTAHFNGFSESNQVIATYDFEGQEVDDLSFRRGDIIDVVKKTVNRDDWWIGRRGSNIGNFPANYTNDV